jgi:mannose-6-phosphate isomerase
MKVQTSIETNKSTIFEAIAKELKKLNFTVIQQDESRPWGGFFVIDESQASAFSAHFFPHLSFSDIQLTNKLSPKILVVAPQKRLSWQYHFRRAEIWRVEAGPVAVKTSQTDEQGDTQVLENGSFIKLEKGERHRLMGLDNWGIVSEIWQHINPDEPSNEEDIVRLQDDFGR